MAPLLAGEPSAAQDLVRIIRGLVPNWNEVLLPALVWTFTDPDPDYEGRYVQVDARTMPVLVVPEMEGAQLGPTVIAYAKDTCLRVTLPNVTDRLDLRGALRAAAAIGALPDDVLTDAVMGARRG